MKKQLSILIVVMTICSFTFGQKFESNGIYYNIISETTPYQVAVTSQNTSYPYNEDYIYADNVTIPASVTHDGKTYSVTTIADYAFGYCSYLTSVTIPHSVMIIENNAFYNCSGLIQFDVPSENMVFSSDEGVLFDKDQGRLIQYPIAKPGTSYVIPNSVTTIGTAAFYNCNGLTSVTIPNSVITIEYAAFYSCTNLASMAIPSSVTTIGSHVFAECWNLTHFEVEEENPSFSTVEGVLFNKNQDVLITYPMSKGGVSYSYVIPNSTTTIGIAAFFHCAGLTSVTIPNSVTTLEEQAFYYCDGLTEIHVEAVTPPTFGSPSVFYNVPTTIPVYVPCESLATYQSAEGWNEFTNIQCETGIAEITTYPYEVYTRNSTLIIKQAEGQSVAIFDMMGRCIFQTIATEETICTLPTAGVYVVRVGVAGFVRKVVVN